jgi:hypothetical protein
MGRLYYVECRKAPSPPGKDGMAFLFYGPPRPQYGVPLLLPEDVEPGETGLPFTHVPNKTGLWEETYMDRDRARLEDRRIGFSGDAATDRAFLRGDHEAAMVVQQMGNARWTRTINLRRGTPVLVLSRMRRMSRFLVLTGEYRNQLFWTWSGLIDPPPKYHYYGDGSPK